MKLSKKHKAALKNLTKLSTLRWIVASILVIIIAFCALAPRFTDEFEDYFLPLAKMLFYSSLALIGILSWFFTFKFIFPSACNKVRSKHAYSFGKKLMLFVALHAVLMVIPAIPGCASLKGWYEAFLVCSLAGLFVGFAIFRVIRPPVCKRCK